MTKYTKTNVLFDLMVQYEIKWANLKDSIDIYGSDEYKDKALAHYDEAIEVLRSIMNDLDMKVIK